MFLPKDFVPGPLDILCGRGNIFSNHEGNRYFLKVIRASLKDYVDAKNRPDKIKVVDNILVMIKNSGARFAKRDNNSKQWYQLNDVQVHQKVGHAIRDNIRLLEKYKKREAFQGKPLMMKDVPIARHTSGSRKRTLPPYASVAPSMGMADILRLSLDTVSFLGDVLGDSKENKPSLTISIPRTSTNDDCIHNQIYKGVENHDAYFYIPSGKRQSSFLLEDEYPETNFEFSKDSFFKDST